MEYSIEEERGEGVGPFERWKRWKKDVQIIISTSIMPEEISLHQTFFSYISFLYILFFITVVVVHIFTCLVVEYQTEMFLFSPSFSLCVCN